jgi:GH15 family glucan-1,4-alpha-glucosidase
MDMDLKQRSIQIIKENQMNNGAYVACPNFDNYKFCWLRDGSFIANAMDRVGEFQSAEKFLEWVHHTIKKYCYKVDILLAKEQNGERLEAADFLATRYTLDGFESHDNWANFQLDGYGTWLWALAEHINYSGTQELFNNFNESVEATVLYLSRFWSNPNFDCWEEFDDKVHPATLACICGGLKSINRYLNRPEVAKLSADILQFVKEHGVLDGRLTKSIGVHNVDASLLWAGVPFGLFSCYDETFAQTAHEIEARLLHQGGVHRYLEDTYYGGGEWLLLSCWIGWYYCETGRIQEAVSILKWVEDQADETGSMAEQVICHVNDPSLIDQWVECWGPVAKPLLWSHAMYLVLLTEIAEHQGEYN